MPSLLRRHRPPVTESPGFGHAELGGEDSRVVLIPELGGKIASLEIAGRQWLWINPAIPFRTPVPGSSYIQHADSGGYDECFPTVAPCTLPPSAETFAGAELQDHGELWSQRPSVELQTRPDGQQATMVWTGVKMPYRFKRIVRVDASGAVSMRYSSPTPGRRAFHSSGRPHPLLPLGEKTRLVLPDGEPVRVYRSERIEMGARRRAPVAEHPHGKGDARPVAAGKHRCNRFASSCSRQRARDRRHRGVWCAPRGPLRSRRRAGLRALDQRARMESVASHSGNSRTSHSSPASCTRYAERRPGGWRRASWLDAGETRKWTLTWTGRPAS